MVYNFQKLQMPLVVLIILTVKCSQFLDDIWTEEILKTIYVFCNVFWGVFEIRMNGASTKAFSTLSDGCLTEHEDLIN